MNKINHISPNTLANYNTNPPELVFIQNFIKKNRIVIHQNNSLVIVENLIPIVLSVNNKEYIIHVNDEYQDFEIKNDLLNFILVFMELAVIDESIDFIDWCKTYGLPPENYKLLSYYKNICTQIVKIRVLFKNNKIDYFVSDLDFQLNSGIIQFLRSK